MDRIHRVSLVSCVAVALSLGLPPVAAAPGPQSPQQNFRNVSAAELKTRAQNGDVAAQVELATRLEHGAPGLPADPEGAMTWLRAAADKGDATAQFELARRLRDAEDPSRQKEAVELLEKSVAQGNANARIELARAYLSGRGTPKNEKQGLDLLQRSAAEGMPEAQFALGEAYLSGAAGRTDPAAAAQQFRLAAAQQHTGAMLELAKMQRSGTAPGGAQEAMQLLLKAAQLGDRDAMREAARIYRDGDGVPKSIEKAAVWLRKLAEARDVEAQSDLAGLSPDVYKKMAKPLTMPGGKPAPLPPGSPVWIDGRIAQATGGQWSLDVSSAGRSTQLPVDAKDYRGQAKQGMAVRVYGPMTSSQGMKALLVDLPQPSVEWRYQLKNPGAAAGQVQKFIVDGAVKNTGKQPLRNVRAKVRLYQTSSPNDASGEIVIPSIAPGEVKAFTATVDFYNFQYVGATSIPKVEMQVISYDW